LFQFSRSGKEIEKKRKLKITLVEGKLTISLLPPDFKFHHQYYLFKKVPVYCSHWLAIIWIFIIHVLSAKVGQKMKSRRGNAAYANTILLCGT